MEPQNRISVPHEQSEYTRQIDALQRQLEAAEHLIHRKNCDLAHVVSVNDTLRSQVQPLRQEQAAMAQIMKSTIDDAYAAGRVAGLREASRKASDAASLLLNTHPSFANVIADALMDFSDILSQDAEQIEQAAQEGGGNAGN